MMGGVVIERPFTRKRDHRRADHATGRSSNDAMSIGRVPRITRLVALALRFDDLLKRHEVQSMAEIARVGHVTRARVTQLLNLRFLAPDIIDEILHLPLNRRGRDPICEHHVRDIAAEPAWATQRAMWRELRTSRGVSLLRPVNDDVGPCGEPRADGPNLPTDRIGATRPNVDDVTPNDS